MKNSGPVTIAVVGLGAIGGVIAGSLAALGRHDVTVCVRTPIDRLVVERPDDTVDVPVRALTKCEDAEPADWVLLCTKAHQTPMVAEWLARLCGPRTRVAVLQNGIRHAERLAPYVGAAAVVPTRAPRIHKQRRNDRIQIRGHDSCREAL